jgi:hypothetical protein
VALVFHREIMQPLRKSSIPQHIEKGVTLAATPVYKNPFIMYKYTGRKCQAVRRRGAWRARSDRRPGFPEIFLWRFGFEDHAGQTTDV